MAVINSSLKIADYSADAEKRYNSKSAQERRKKHLKAAEQRKKSRDFKNTDDPDRIKVRKKLLNKNDTLGQERILGGNDLLSVNYLEQGTLAGKSVCRIQVRNSWGQIESYGTGFLVSPNLLLTNNHVLTHASSAARSFAEFNFEDDANFVPKDSKIFQLDPKSFFITDRRLDYTLVAIKNTSTGGTPLSDFDYLKLVSRSGKATFGEHVTIIQHPSGKSKSITLRDNEIVDTFDDFVHYESDTQPGSSGSPVFNDQWQVVALHHAGVPKRNKQGVVLNIHDKPWDDETMGPELIAWVANEGIRISKILTHANRQRLDAEKKRLLSEVAGDFEDDTDEFWLPPVTFDNVERTSKTDLRKRKGYDTRFLGTLVSLPKIKGRMKREVAKLTGTKRTELKYTNFSVVQNKKRKLPFFTAVNIDGKKHKKLKRKPDKWYFDSRIPEDWQAGPDLYYDNDLDIGHMVRRLDPVWGRQYKTAEKDTFHFTNAAPQHLALNRRTWLGLERHILKNAKKHDLKVTVFTGPVLGDHDMISRDDYQIPAEFWKVVAMVKDDGDLSVSAYLLTQKNLIQDLEFAFGKYKTYQISVKRIEKITNIDFGKLRRYDQMPKYEKESHNIGKIITRVEDVIL